MTVFEKHMTLALALSAVFVILNIIAVTNGSADTYYTTLEQLLKS